MHAERLDGFVGLAGCDKSIPAMLMAAARLDLPAVFVYNGSIMPGEHNGPGARHHQRVRGGRRRAPPARSPRTSSREIERKACPGEGACGGMFTANTMSSIAEAIGMSLPGHGVAAGDRRAAATTTPARAGEAVVQHARARHHARARS